MARIRKAKSFDQRFTGHVTALRVATLTKRSRPCVKCGGKLLHRTRAQAGKHVHHLAGCDKDAWRLQVYRCPHQEGFHVGHGFPDDVAESAPARAGVVRKVVRP